MRIEKKLIGWSILAIALGVAAIVPLEYMMGAEAQANALANAAVTNIKPWFDVNVTYAYCKLDEKGGNDTTSFDGALIQAIANFTLTPDALDLKNADARIEFYLFQVSSDQGPIVNITYSIAVSKEEKMPGAPGGVFTYITGSGANTFNFADGTTYNGPKNGDCGGGIVLYNMPSIPTQKFANAVLSDYICSVNGNNAPQALTDLRNAKILYIDVSRERSVSFKGNATSATTTTLSSNQVLQRIVLTKTGDGFVYGAYVEGTVPFPIETP